MLPTVLLVEDSDDFRAIVRASLKDTADVVEVSDLRAARKSLEREAYDLVLLDLKLPDGNGMEIVDHFKSTLGRMSDIPVIILSGVDEVDRMLHGFKFGVRDYITKPVRPSELKVRIEAHLKRIMRERELGDLEHRLVRVGEIALDPVASKLIVDTATGSKARDLEVLEMHLMQWFMQRAGRVIYKKDLAAKLKQEGLPSNERVFQSSVDALNRKLVDSSYWIESIFDIGYRLSSHA